jgi:lysophospholipase L1-like esterase
MPSWFDGEVAELERRTRALSGARNLVLFYGSSSFTLWHDMAAHFPGYEVVNHGFGGSTLRDCLEYFDRLVAAMMPRVIVLYAGDNDLGDGGTPEVVLDRLRTFIRRKREALGETPMAYVSIKISPARFSIMHRIAYTNRLIERELGEQADVTFVDITRRMVGRGLGPLLGYYTEDPLHMNRDGYRVLGKSLAEFLGKVEAGAGDLRVRAPAAAPAWLIFGEADEPDGPAAGAPRPAGPAYARR